MKPGRVLALAVLAVLGVYLLGRLDARARE
jgi:hypothetical protein